LIEATGREKGGLNSAPTQADLAIVSSVPYNNQSNDVSSYTQTFEYDKLGNILNMSSQNKWSRDYFYDTATNRLLKHDEYGQNEYTYDTHGNMHTMPGISEMNWDFGDKLNKTISGTVTSYYNYDSGGERTRKVVLKQGGIREERYYINGYEVYRKLISDVIDIERQTLHIAIDRKRFAIIDTLTIENGVTLGTPDVTIRYQYDNHLGSSSLELDESANAISYEEYHPFGTSSYRLGTNEAEVQLKRYRYVGKERDEETGLYYYGARYYAAWLCRFVSVDPLQHEYPHYTPYQYAGNKPVTYIDLDGLEEAKPNNQNVMIILGPTEAQKEAENNDNGNNGNWIIFSAENLIEAYSEINKRELNNIQTLVFKSHGSHSGPALIPDAPTTALSEIARAKTITSIDLMEFLYSSTLSTKEATIDSIGQNKWDNLEAFVNIVAKINNGGNLIFSGCRVGQGSFPETLAKELNRFYGLNLNVYANMDPSIQYFYDSNNESQKTFLNYQLSQYDVAKGLFELGFIKVSIDEKGEVATQTLGKTIQFNSIGIPFEFTLPEKKEIDIKK
jgi:RHS repeat-associated protein